MRKKLAKHTSNFVAKETALIVFIILLIVAGFDLNRQIKTARTSAPIAPEAECVQMPDGHDFCVLGRNPVSLDKFKEGGHDGN
jgi:hypothetical protein